MTKRPAGKSAAKSAGKARAAPAKKSGAKTATAAPRKPAAKSINKANGAAKPGKAARGPAAKPAAMPEGASFPGMPLFAALDPAIVEAEVSRPAAGKVLSGDPVHATWNMEERDGLFCGIWQSTAGKWRISYDEWEFCHILEGVSIITEDGGEARTVMAGDSFILRPGFTGTWEVIATTRKEYVIRL